MSDAPIYPASADDQAMIDAMTAARNTFKFFWRELHWEHRRVVPGLQMAAVKVAFDTDADGDDIPPVEHIWISDIKFDGQTIYGTLLNQPHWVSSLNEGDPVTTTPEAISDWMFAADDSAYGGHTVQVMRAQMSKSERKQHDAAWGLDFGKPNQVRLIYQPKAGLFSRLFGPKKEAPDPNTTEHPMSETCADQFATALAQDPTLATSEDDEGWTLLQRETMAGNDATTAVLLEHGADFHQKNPNGHSALDLAWMMDWPRLIQRFEDHAAEKG